MSPHEKLPFKVYKISLKSVEWISGLQSFAIFVLKS
jgi:hypothetical protein